MSSTNRPRHVVVDGSNIATEGRSMPSLAQLNEAVLAFMAERPEVTVTVVVDATFGHRIHKSEVAEFDAAVANNELVAPPAGAVGRGDAFVLGIADKAGAMVLSNDSFQEFHGTYDWLFDEGRLVGGKPVPHVGWVFVDRVPVRGPVSRRAVREPSKRPGSGGRAASGTARVGSKEASQPMPVPTSPPPGRSGSGRSGGRGRQPAEAPVLLDTRTAPAAAAKVAAVAGTGSTDRPAGRAGEPVNDVMPFLDFVEHHPVGSSVNATVESYSSHGAYVTIGEVRGYVPLRLMDDPMPRAAKHVMKIGDAVTLVVVSFNPGRRSIDCAVPHMVGGLHLDEVLPPAEEDGGDGEAAPPSKRSRSTRKKAAAAPAETTTASSTRSPRKRTAATKAAATTAPATGPEAAAAPAATATPAKKAAAKRTATKAAAAPSAGQDASTSDAAATGTPAKAARSRKAPATPASTPTPTADGPAPEAPTAKAPSTRSAATKTAAAKAPATKTPGTKTTGTKAAATKAAATKTAAAKTAAAKTAASKQAATKAPAAKKAAAGRSTAKATKATKATKGATPAAKRASKQSAAERSS